MTKEISKLNIEGLEDLNQLDEKSRKLALDILKEYSDTGYSEIMNELTYEDYRERPVDIITFIKDPNYLGKAWHLPSGKCKLFPYWEKRLQELFPDPVKTEKNNVILSGARGLGKSEIAITIGAYLMYRLMCLKNPYEVLNLKPTEKVAFAFMNITEILAEDIGISKFQATVQASPWFMSHGTITGKTTLVWNPPDFINIIIGSQPRHVIGQAIYFAFFDSMTSQGLSIVHLLLKKAKSVEFALACPQSQQKNKFIYDTSLESNLKNLAREAGIEIEEKIVTSSNFVSSFISNNIYLSNPQNINLKNFASFWECSTADAQFEAVAREIKSHVVLGGRYSDCVVGVSALDENYCVMKRIFEDYEIPCFFDVDLTLAQTKPIEFLNLVFEFVEEKDIYNVFVFHHFCDRTALHRNDTIRHGRQCLIMGNDNDRLPLFPAGIL